MATSYIDKSLQSIVYKGIIKYMLWFDVEERYNTTDLQKVEAEKGCGLM